MIYETQLLFNVCVLHLKAFCISTERQTQINLMENGCVKERWMEITQDRVQLRAFVGWVRLYCHIQYLMLKDRIYHYFYLALNNTHLSKCRLLKVEKSTLPGCTICRLIILRKFNFYSLLAWGTWHTRRSGWWPEGKQTFSFTSRCLNQ